MATSNIIFMLTLLPIVCMIGQLIEAAHEIKHLQINEAHLIETSPNNLAVTTPLLQSNGWKSVSLNGNNILVISPQCVQTSKTVDSLSQQERSMLFNAIQQLQQVETGNYNMNLDGQQVYRSGSTIYSMYGQSQSSSQSSNINMATFNSNDGSITKYADDSMSVSYPDMPGNLARVFYDSNEATFVYKDGQVLMKPTSCLEPQEATLVSNYKKEAQLAEQKFQSDMNMFNQNMADWQMNMNSNFQQMHQGMQNMHQGFNGMFANHHSHQPYDPYYNGQGYYPQHQQQQQQANNWPFGSNNSPFWQGFPF